MELEELEGPVTKENISSIRDNLGRGLDPGIESLVLELNRLGFETMASCEGHLDHGCIGPWVDIEKSPKIPSLVNRFNKEYRLPKEFKLYLGKLYDARYGAGIYHYRLMVNSWEANEKGVSGMSKAEFSNKAKEVMGKFTEYISSME